MSVFLDALARKPVPHTPIWLMRQAGRYQASYQAIRSKVSFLELCKTPDLACQVTVDAVDQLGVDAAIIFADILLILEPLGVPFGFEKGHGPKIHTPVRTAAQVDALAEKIDAKESLGFVMEAIRLTRAALDVPLIGFCGAPFTLASYAIEGGGSKNYYEAKKLMFGDEGLWNTLMEKISTALGAYLNAQIDAGAQAVQMFDSWIGALSPAEYRRYVFPHSKRVLDAVKDRGVPVIHFGTGNAELYPHMQDAGGTCIGVDWRVSMTEARLRLGPDVALMGNLDPAYLLAPVDVMNAAADAVLAEAQGRPGHVFNLGHGIMPQTTVDQVRALVDHVHEASQR
ncbi:MAG TPA: uroporphyrinogen decarboxylase [Polyangiaceae bacterium LLY-WYZ-15_(1-7)]|nr:uroporphyrinogen decarboxylase [Myxococcales bacterium]MAT28362.1 uroporphyrinogen decarboxylase [Sandaracinus sp.]HJK95154.1 uroporphyrinogen decarboxylase [Polyangiaceae bacterium LLY-WYZ-15_(1-7)]MBJ73090.1 uroporphyrinogen decarboxylase [Sandaracinus sp.]HJL04058.1 uroporphyrinogen decarboxylase [Polyangiaceae bacterium LLY-WYZ-15_(1-7)]